MSRILRVAAAQLGPIARAAAARPWIAPMLDLLAQAHARLPLVVFPELALTTFFPRWYMTDLAEVDAWFERAMPNAATRPLFERGAELGIGFFGYAESTPDGHRFNTAILVDPDGRIVGKYRKVHLPGHAEFDPQRAVPAPGEALFRGRRPRLPGVAHDGRHHRHVHLQRPALARDLSGHGAAGRRAGHARLQHAVAELATAAKRRICGCSTHTCRSRPAPTRTPTYAVASAKGGVEDGHELFGGIHHRQPDGEIVAQAQTEGDELIVADCDLDATVRQAHGLQLRPHRRIEHYGRITARPAACRR